MKRIIGVSLAALSTAGLSTCPLLVSTRAQAAVAPLDASYGSSTNTINFAGPATGTLVIAGKTYKFKNGTCTSIKVGDITVEVTLGSVVQGKDGSPAKGNGKKPYFSIDLTSSSPLSDGLSAAYYGGKKLSDASGIKVTGSVVKSGSSKGTFSNGISVGGVSPPSPDRGTVTASSPRADSLGFRCCQRPPKHWDSPPHRVPRAA